MREIIKHALNNKQYLFCFANDLDSSMWKSVGNLYPIFDIKSPKASPYIVSDTVSSS